jgi:hypothetical protein
VPESADSARPVVRAAAGFHHDLARRKLNKEGEKFPAGKSLALRNAPVCIRDGELKDIFCQIDTNDRSIHVGLLLVRLSLKHHTCSAWHIDAVLPSRRSPFQQFERSRV